MLLKCFFFFKCLPWLGTDYSQNLPSKLFGNIHASCDISKPYCKAWHGGGVPDSSSWISWLPSSTCSSAKVWRWKLSCSFLNFDRVRWDKGKGTKDSTRRDKISLPSREFNEQSHNSLSNETWLHFERCFFSVVGLSPPARPGKAP